MTDPLGPQGQANPKRETFCSHTAVPWNGHHEESCYTRPPADPAQSLYDRVHPLPERTSPSTPSEAEALVERADWERAVERIRQNAERVKDDGLPVRDEKYLYATKPATILALLNERASLRTEVERLQEQAEHIEVGYKASLDVYVAAQQRDLKRVTDRLDLAMRVVAQAGERLKEQDTRRGR